jgi:hypothetical protein
MRHHWWFDSVKLYQELFKESYFQFKGLNNKERLNQLCRTPSVTLFVLSKTDDKQFIRHVLEHSISYGNSSMFKMALGKWDKRNDIEWIVKYVIQKGRFDFINILSDEGIHIKNFTTYLLYGLEYSNSNLTKVLLENLGLVIPKVLMREVLIAGYQNALSILLSYYQLTKADLLDIIIFYSTLMDTTKLSAIPYILVSALSKAKE